MNAKVKSRNIVKVQDSSVVDALGKVGMVVLFSVGIAIGIWAFVSMGSGMIAAGGPIKFIASMFTAL